jgi:pimeloyl-ACP methyl ester carboxylesterase
MNNLLALLVVLSSIALPAVGATPGTPAGRVGDVPAGGDVRIHHVEHGDPNAKVSLVFVPGWATSTAIWRDQMARFSSGARVVSIDPRSQGESSIAVQAKTPEQAG